MTQDTTAPGPIVIYSVQHREYMLALLLHYTSWWVPTPADVCPARYLHLFTIYLSSLSLSSSTYLGHRSALSPYVGQPSYNTKKVGSRRVVSCVKYTVHVSLGQGIRARGARHSERGGRCLAPSGLTRLLLFLDLMEPCLYLVLRPPTSNFTSPAPSSSRSECACLRRCDTLLGRGPSGDNIKPLQYRFAFTAVCCQASGRDLLSQGAGRACDMILLYVRQTILLLLRWLS